MVGTTLARTGRLHQVGCVEIRVRIPAAVQQTSQAPRRDQQPASRLAAIAAAQLHRRTNGGGRDLVQRRGKWNRSFTLRLRRRGEEELLGVQLADRRQQQRSLHGILQLADVSGPGMGAKQVAHLRRQRRHGQIVLPGEPLEQRLGDEDEIVAPLPQGRQPEHDRAQAEEQIFPEASLAHPLREPLVGRRQNAHVHRARFRPSDPADLLVLQHAQQLSLETEGQVADLVQEERAGVRPLEQPGFGRMGVRERAALVTEHLRLYEVFRKGRAVDRHERGAAARSADVDRPREELLPGPRLPDDQSVRVAVGQKSGCPGQILLEGRALAHDTGERIPRTGRRGRRARPAAAECGRDRIAEDLEMGGEREVVARPAGHELHGRAPPGIRPHDQHRQSLRDPVAFEPLDRVPFRAARCENDSDCLRFEGRGGREGFRRAKDVDGDTEVQGGIIPEFLERFGDCDYAQPGHDGASSRGGENRPGNVVLRLDKGRDGRHIIASWSDYRGPTERYIVTKYGTTLSSVKGRKRAKLGPVAERLTILLDVFSPWEGISLTYRQFAAEIGPPVTEAAVKKWPQRKKFPAEIARQIVTKATDRGLAGVTLEWVLWGDGTGPQKALTTAPNRALEQRSPRAEAARQASFGPPPPPPPPRGPPAPFAA